MKYLMIGLLVLMFTGCTTKIHKAKQEVACKDKGGIYRYGTLGGITLQCSDGSVIAQSIWKSITGPEVTKALKEIK